ncbi:MarR family winged helix-turn-helix transcriptional regulator [Aureicoccus marinus]|jgi:DNA-binding MarR family transcriptional regulator|uniref:HTH marR-type domain-containing protein n=1 Tax=Aureicoccus marinus TaxID=754435 RepID=A0A2S7T8S8_9FLAO|nr:MarR family transcriptional regulator [Aureicoccus marinus]PQJ15866.1 hypothetical protein BST99_09125 [Aureicoccus marinus]
MLQTIDAVSGIGFHLDMVLRTIQLAYTQRFREVGVEISVEQWVFLQRIHNKGGEAPQRELVRLNFRNKATTSRLIQGLVKKELLTQQRFEGDRKRFNLVLTEKGLELVQKLEPIAQELRSQAIAGIDESQWEIFLQILDKVRDNYSE